MRGCSIKGGIESHGFSTAPLQALPLKLVLQPSLHSRIPAQKRLHGTPPAASPFGADRVRRQKSSAMDLDETTSLLYISGCP